MRNRVLPSFVRQIGEPTIQAHSRGFAGDAGQGLYERAPGAAWRWQMALTAKTITEALQLRAWLHSLRGPAGTFTAPVPLRIDPVLLPPSGVGYSDGTVHTDGTDYDDHSTTASTWFYPSWVTTGTLTAGAAKGATVIAVTGITPAAGHWLTIAGRLLRVVAVSGGNVTVRPALREAALTGAAVSHGKVTATWRLVGQPPAVPLIVGRSLPLTIDVEEAY